MTDNRVVLMGCGDIGPIHEPVSRYCALVRETLATADIRFAQAERVYSERGELGSGSDHGLLKPHMASVFKDCGFDVVSMAGNHCMDFGADAMFDSIATLKNYGMQVVGAGRNLREARQPVIVERNGVRIAFLAFCSVLRKGYAAGENKPGVAPIRVHARCEKMEYQPGVPPMVVTTPYKGDLAALEREISKAKESAHVVVLSLHWGIHFIPRMIADYQPIVAKAAFEAGADLILGHHAHAPKAIGVFDGKVCFYSLGNFIFSTVAKSAEKNAEFARRYSVVIDQDYPHLPMGRDANRSLIAKAVLSREGIRRVSFLPVEIDRDLRPDVLHRADSRFEEAVRFMDWVSDGHAHLFTLEDDEVVVKEQSRSP